MSNIPIKKMFPYLQSVTHFLFIEGIAHTEEIISRWVN